jgi:hypothetical protein
MLSSQRMILCILNADYTYIPNLRNVPYLPFAFHTHSFVCGMRIYHSFAIRNLPPKFHTVTLFGHSTGCYVFTHLAIQLNTFRLPFTLVHFPDQPQRW